MRLFLVITLFFTSLPIAARVRTGTLEPPTVISHPAPDETPSPTPTPTPDPVLDQAKREALIADELKKKAVADKERAAAEAERLKALALPFGTPSNVQIPSGNVQTDAAGWVESQMLAQEAARQITKRLVDQLCTQSHPFLAGGVIPPFPPEPPDTDESTNTNSNGGASPPPTPTPSPSPSPGPQINTLVIHNPNDLTGVELYNAVKGQLIQLREEFRRENGETNNLLNDTNPNVRPVLRANVSSVAGVLAAPGIATGVIKSVAELLNLFRTETRFENRSVQISEDIVVSHLVNNLASAPNGRCAATIQVYYPALFPAKLVESSSSSQLVTILNRVERFKFESGLHVERIDARVKELNALLAKMDEIVKKNKVKTQKGTDLAAKQKEEKEVCKRVRSAECTRVRRQIEELKNEIEKLGKEIKDLDDAIKAIKNPNVDTADEIKDKVVELEKQKSRLQALVTSTDLLSSRLNTPDATSKLTALAQLLRAEKLHNILRNANTFILRVAVTANGTTKIKKNLFVDAKVRHSAGANLVYQLFNSNGGLAQGDVMQCYIDYRSSQDIFAIVNTPSLVRCPSVNTETVVAGK